MIDKVNSITEYAIKSILTWTNENPDLAHQVSLNLASLDWQQTIVAQQQQKINSMMRVMGNFIDSWEKGYRPCDNCEEKIYEGGYHYGDCIRVYSWPHPFPAYSYLPIDSTVAKKYCLRCLHKLEEQITIELSLKYNEEHPNSQKTFILLNNRTSQCHTCKRLVPSRSGYHFQYGFYCLHCVEGAIKLQFTPCQICGRRTASLMRGTCYDCYSTPQSLRSQVSIHLARARSSGTPATLTVKQWIETIDYFNKKCAYCRTRPFQVLEHFVPINLGGGTTMDNCVPACTSCNSKKNSTHPDTLILMGRFSYNTIEHIKNYLQGEKHKNKFLAATGRELAIVQK